MDSPDIHLVLPEKTVKGYDRWVARLQLTVPGGMGITRADLMRDQLEKALQAHEAEVEAQAQVEAQAKAAKAQAPPARAKRTKRRRG